ncbi:DNA polymerase III subunit gamma and tau [Streptomyces eurocidicus]|uniref:DNA polymerase III subunit gamma and tau n=1 Tax=Streptomyces eurocidicus TaxID=66423 RepID=UPI001FCF9ED4|nr:DNA polymerase III subunit gamma and tau [Streptomyces eurocidicus]
MSSLALYRRYRPESFAEVIGQEHVTAPLQQALRNNRVNHAYLFSGPRGCGKTTSARILARCLNCEQGPTPTPCGECQSCIDLARNGRGSIDVIEIDAASHGGVDDARDLREKAFFGPAASRYKIYIIDEAHMVTSAGFNALLKVVEEPPEHLKFIFATTEPEKVIGTIRSRTHHYPFRLVPPGTLREYLGEVCGQEKIPVEDGVLPLVVRAGAGSVRDSMSVMDQLLAGAAEDGVTYAMATSLLGYTDGSLLDAVVDAFAASDGAAAFEVVDRVIEGGNDPRRFVADLLERLRDLVILAAVPDAVEKGLIDAPVDLVERMQAQASVFGAAELSRAADLVNEGLTEMRGATSPRLQLELICARVLLPAAFDDERSVRARLDKLERGALAAGGGMVTAPMTPPAGYVPAPHGSAPAAGYAPGPDAHAAPSAPAAPQVAPAAPPPGFPAPPRPAPRSRARPLPARLGPASGAPQAGAWPSAAAPRAPPRPLRHSPGGPAATPTAGAWPTAAAPARAVPARPSPPAPGRPPPPRGRARPHRPAARARELVRPAVGPGRRRARRRRLLRAPDVAEHPGSRQEPPSLHLDHPQPERRRGRLRRHHPPDRLRQPRSPRLLRQQRQRGRPPPGRRRCDERCAVEDRPRRGPGRRPGRRRVRRWQWRRWRLRRYERSRRRLRRGARREPPGGAGGYGTPGGFGGGPAATGARRAARPPRRRPRPGARARQAPPAASQAHREPEPPPVAPEDDMPAEDDPDLVDSALTGHDLIVRELGATVIEEIANE